MDTIDGKIGEKSVESKMKSEENVGVSEAQAKNIPKIYREISPMSGAYAPAVGWKKFEQINFIFVNGIIVAAN